MHKLLQQEVIWDGLKPKLSKSLYVSACGAGLKYARKQNSTQGSPMVSLSTTFLGNCYAEAHRKLELQNYMLAPSPSKSACLKVAREKNITNR